MSEGPAILEGVISTGDLVAVTGDADFYEALLRALGSRAFGFVSAELDNRPDVKIGQRGGQTVLTFPNRPGSAAVPVDAEGVDDPRVLLIYASHTASQREHLCGLAPAVLEGLSATFGRVLKVDGHAVAGMAVRIIDGEAVVSRLPRGLH